MDSLVTMKMFVLIANGGTFSSVAKALGTTQPTVSRTIAALEKHLGVRLFHRSTRALTLTDDGKLFLTMAQRALDAVADAENSIMSRATTATGLLRLGTPLIFGKMLVAPLMPEFLALNPKIDVELVMDDNSTDLVSDSLDLAVRVNEQNDQLLVARRLGESRRATVASRDYLRRRGEPKEPSDLVRHDCVVNTKMAPHRRWRFEGSGGPLTVEVGGRFFADDSETVRDAVLAGVGITLAPIWLFSEAIARDEVQVILPGFAPPPSSIQAVYSSRRHLSGRVRVMIDFLANSFKGYSCLAQT